MSALQEAKKNILNSNHESRMRLRFEVSNKDFIQNALEVKDLTSDTNKEHIINVIFNNLVSNLNQNKFKNIKIIRGPRIVSALDNFDNLLFPIDNVGRSSTYTRYIDEDNVLRTHTSAQIPRLFRDIKDNLVNSDADETTFVIPGLVYRRDVIDPKHLDVFHQIDVWQLLKKTSKQTIDRENLLGLAKVVFDTFCPGAEMKVLEAVHPYTVNGIEVYAKIGDTEIEIFEAGLIHPNVLTKAGLDKNEYTGLALGMGVERLIMARKKLPDIRLIRSSDPRIVKQMSNMEVYVPVSNMPKITRDMSYCINSNDTEEDICENIKEACDDYSIIEEVIILSRVSYDKLNNIAIEKLGAKPGQDNILIRVILRHPDKTLTKEFAESTYRIIYNKVNLGEKGYI